MSFQENYQILTALGDGESQSFRARQVPSGRLVLVHYLPADQAPSPQPDLPSLIFSFLRGASAEKSRQLLDMGEDEGHIIVVTEDAPECLDLRRWLQSGLDPQAGEPADTHPAGEPFGPAPIRSTRVFNAEALRQARSIRQSTPGSPRPLSAPPSVPPKKESPGALMPPAEIPAAPSPVNESGPPSVVGFWEKFSQADAEEPAAPIPTPPMGQKNADVPSLESQGTAVSFPQRSSLSVHDAPAEVMTTLPAPSADRGQAPAKVSGSASCQGNAGDLEDFVLTPTAVREPLVAPREAEENWTEKAPHGQIQGGFEVVFQSSKPRLPPSWGDLPDRPGVVAAPEPIAPPSALASRKVLPESERVTVVAPEPQGSPAPSAPQSQVDKSASTRSGAPPVVVPIPTSPRRLHPGDYTRMVQDGKALGVPPNPVTAAPRQPSLYLAHDPPLPSAGRKRKVWVPILILSSLFLTTVALLVFFAFRH